jgi:hypothetical protein
MYVDLDQIEEPQKVPRGVRNREKPPERLQDAPEGPKRRQYVLK